MKGKLKRAGWNDAFLASLLALFGKTHMRYPCSATRGSKALRDAKPATKWLSRKFQSGLAPPAPLALRQHRNGADFKIMIRATSLIAKSICGMAVGKTIDQHEDDYDE
jgi:hypothetical protein